jgi:hypothetical protein
MINAVNEAYSGFGGSIQLEQNYTMGSQETPKVGLKSSLSNTAKSYR